VYGAAKGCKSIESSKAKTSSSYPLAATKINGEVEVRDSGAIRPKAGPRVAVERVLGLDSERRLNVALLEETPDEESSSSSSSGGGATVGVFGVSESVVLAESLPAPLLPRDVFAGFSATLDLERLVAICRQN
jgi:hypothetical protein